MRNGHTRFTGLLLAAVFALLGSQGAVAEEVGQVTGLHAEARTVVIDGQAYRLSSDAELGYADQPGRLLALQMIRQGQPVTYEARVDADGNRVITRLMLLSE